MSSGQYDLAIEQCAGLHFSIPLPTKPLFII